MIMPGLQATILSAVVAFCVAALANWQMRRPYHRRWLPVLPWLGVQFLGATIFLVMLAHLISLLIGHPFGRSYAP